MLRSSDRTALTRNRGERIRVYCSRSLVECAAAILDRTRPTLVDGQDRSGGELEEGKEGNESRRILLGAGSLQRYFQPLLGTVSYAMSREAPEKRESTVLNIGKGLHKGQNAWE